MKRLACWGPGAVWETDKPLKQCVTEKNHLSLVESTDAALTTAGRSELISETASTHKYF